MRLAVLASGSGTILEAMINGGIPVVYVLTDRKCLASEIALQHGIDHALVERESFGKDFDRKDYTIQIRDALIEREIDLVAMAGFGTILEQPIYEEYGNNVLNTHPSLLPSFPGWNAVEDAIRYGVKVTGCTVHVATKDVDAGPILAQEAVEVSSGDSVATLHERIKTIERRLYLETIRDIMEEGQVVIPKEKTNPT
ncbi:MAG: phosphoribosylglycinamide formyltransferase [Acidimicrobiaceae bacterium]|nr:phosphoribosylglycinamide formyltransferase [Acidimicrobiaceae bacterium]